MANKKITKKEYFAIVKGIVKASNADNKADIVAFIDHEVELLDKKSGKSKVTPTQAANAVTLNIIKEVLTERTSPATITELLTDTRLQSYTEATKDGYKVIAMTNQKLSSLVKKLVDFGEVVRTEEKKKAYFSIAVEEEETDDPNQFLNREVRV